MCRWCVTGTPITTSMNDVLQQARFLRMPVVKGFVLNRRALVAPGVMATALRQLLMMHRASQTYPTGEPLVSLPPRHDHVVECELDAGERKLYTHVYTEARNDMKLLVDGGERLAARFYTRIVSSVLLPARMILAHPAVMSELMRVQFGLQVRSFFQLSRKKFIFEKRN